MFFSKKDKNKDIEEIKKAMDDDSKQSYKDDDLDMPELMHEEYPSPRRGFKPGPRAEHQEHGMVAPLFVKVEKYRELLSTVQTMKVFVSGIKQIFNVLQELETVRAESLKTMRASVQKLERSVTEMDTELLRPRGVDFTDLVESEDDVRHIEDSLTDLQKQIAALRRELKELE